MRTQASQLAQGIGDELSEDALLRAEGLLRVSEGERQVDHRLVVSPDSATKHGQAPALLHS